MTSTLTVNDTGRLMVFREGVRGFGAVHLDMGDQTACREFFDRREFTQPKHLRRIAHVDPVMVMGQDMVLCPLCFHSRGSMVTALESQGRLRGRMFSPECPPQDSQTWVWVADDREEFGAAHDLVRDDDGHLIEPRTLVCGDIVGGLGYEIPEQVAMLDLHCAPCVGCFRPSPF